MDGIRHLFICTSLITGSNISGARSSHKIRRIAYGTVLFVTVAPVATRKLSYTESGQLESLKLHLM
jgi:hypothetical protein